jgi:hypothetical protein
MHEAHEVEILVHDERGMAMFQLFIFRDNPKELNCGTHVGIASDLGPLVGGCHDF